MCFESCSNVLGKFFNTEQSCRTKTSRVRIQTPCSARTFCEADPGIDGL